MEHTNKTSTTKKVAFWLDQKTILALQTIRAQTGLSMSSAVREALHNYFSFSEVKEAAKKLQQISENLLVEVKTFEEYRLPEMRAEIREMIYQIKQLNSRLNNLTEALEVVAFWAALALEILKTRIFNTTPLSPQEYEKFKKLWHLAHERADARIETLMGKRIWKQKFDPEKNSLK